MVYIERDGATLLVGVRFFFFRGTFFNHEGAHFLSENRLIQPDLFHIDLSCESSYKFSFVSLENSHITKATQFSTEHFT